MRTSSIIISKDCLDEKKIKIKYLANFLDLRNKKVISRDKGLHEKHEEEHERTIQLAARSLLFSCLTLFVVPRKQSEFDCSRCCGFDFWESRNFHTSSKRYHEVISCLSSHF